MSHIYKSSKKYITIIGAIAIAALFISTVTAVPQVNGKFVVEKLDEQEKIKTILEIFNVSGSEEQNMNKIVYLMLLLSDGLLQKIKNPSKQFSINDIFPNDIQTLSKDISNEELSNKADNILDELQNTLNEYEDGNSIIPTDNPILNFIKNIIQFIINLITSLLENNQPNNGEGTLLEKIKSVLTSIITIIITILVMLLNAILGVLLGIARILVALFRIILQIIAGIQTALTLSAFFFVFLGYIAKIGIKIFSIMGAPIFAYLATQLSIALGSFLGGLTQALFSIIGLLLLFALPLGIAALLYLMSSEEGDETDDEGGGFNFGFNFNGNGLIYMILSIFLNILKN